MKTQFEDEQLWPTATRKAINRMIKKANKLNNKMAELKLEAATYGVEVWGEDITVVSPYKEFSNPFVLLVEEACK